MLSLKQSLLRILRKKRLQPMWEGFVHYSRIGMNFGGGSDLFQSGEIYALEFARKNLSDNTELTVFDVGANVGDYTQLCLDTLGPNCRVFAFEPSNVAHQSISRRFPSNTNENVTVLNFGLSDASCELPLYSPAEGATVASMYKNRYIFGERTAEIEETISLTTVDEYCKTEQIQRIDYLKLDIEGHEFAALKGAERMISEKRVQFIQFEFGRCCLAARVFFKDFYDFLTPEFRLYRIVSDGVHPIGDYRTLHENFETVNYLAELVG
ncbi:MAG: FkbM family methyltransferase [Aridibacter famidurans]|nr:FkbM family methyltransferase [Aridibacter famidurans]